MSDMSNNNPNNMSNQNINLMTHFSPLRTPGRLLSATRSVMLSLVCLLTALLLPATAHAQNPYAVIDGNVMTLYYGTDMDGHEGAIDVTEKFNGAYEWPKAVYQADLEKVIFDASFAQYSPISLKNLFGADWKEGRLVPCFGNLKEIVGIENLNTHEVTDMSYMLYGCSSLQSLDLSSFDTQNVTNMYDMFSGCSALQSLDLSSFNTQNVTAMNGMFYLCSSLQSLDLSSFDTHNVTHMNAMFYGCSSLQTLDLSSFNTQNVTTMGYMFRSCNSLQRLDLSTFNTENVMKMSYMFRDCSSLQSLDLSSFDTQNVTQMRYMFWDCSSLHSVDLSSFNTQNVTDMEGVFYGCNNLQSVDLSSFNTQNVTDFSRMFTNCTNLATVTLGPDFTKLGEWAFYNCSSLATIHAKAITPEATAGNAFDDAAYYRVKLYVPEQAVEAYRNTPNWNKFYTINDVDYIGRPYAVIRDREMTLYYGTDMADHEGAFDVTEKFNGAEKWPEAVYQAKLQKVIFDKSFADYRPTNLYNLFGGYWQEHDLIPGFREMKEIEGIEYLNTEKVTNMRDMFHGCSSLQSLNLSTFNTQNVTDMNYMFSNCTSLQNLNLSSFNTQNVTGMNGMFYRCFNLQSLDLSSFNTQNVTGMFIMFSGCTSLQSLDISSFDTRNVTTIDAMFWSCSSLQSLDLSNFDTQKVWGMSEMFSNCSALQNLDLYSFDTQNVEHIDGIFKGCTKLASVTLGPDFKKLGEEAFYNCPSLATINAKADAPEATAENAFDEAQFENVRLNVPVGSIEAYRNTGQWNKFVNIREVDFGHVVEIDPLEENQEVTFDNGDITPETDLGGTVVGNVYYNVETDDGGYDAASGCIVINKATSDSQLSAVQGEELGSEAFKEAFTGLVVMVPAGKGTLKVTAESVGGMVLKVKIGNQPAAQLTLKGKMTGEFAYDVAEDTYIYIYGGDATAQARARRNVSVADKALKIYSVSWTKGVSDGIDTISTDGQPAVIYNLRGQRVKTMDKGVYIVNGKKVVKM